MRVLLLLVALSAILASAQTALVALGNSHYTDKCKDMKDGSCGNYESPVDTPHPVICVSETEKAGWRNEKLLTCTKPIWASSQAVGCKRLGFDAAKALCKSFGARLPLKDEADNGCTAGSGCQFDFYHVWTIPYLPTAKPTIAAPKPTPKTTMATSKPTMATPQPQSAQKYEIEDPPEDDRTYSSVYKNEPIGGKLRQSMLSSPYAWVPAQGPKHKYEAGESLTMDLKSVKMVGGVVTRGQGNWNQWVTVYAVSVSTDGKSWKGVGEFKGNTDRNTEVEHHFSAIPGRYVRITIGAWEHAPALRAAVITCTSTLQWCPKVSNRVADGEPIHHSASQNYFKGTMAACQAICDKTPHCNAVVHQTKFNRCWLRSGAKEAVTTSKGSREVALKTCSPAVADESAVQIVYQRSTYGIHEAAFYFFAVVGLVGTVGFGYKEFSRMQKGEYEEL